MKNQRLTEESQPPEHSPTKVGIRGEESQLAARVREAIGDSSVSAFGRRCGLGESVLRKYLQGAVPSSDNLVAIADAANVSIEWLAAGRGPKQRSASALPATAQPQPTVNLEDIDRLTLAMEAVEEGLGPRYNHATPKQRAQLVAAAYDLLLDMDQKSNVIKFIKLAA